MVYTFNNPTNSGAVQLTQQTLDSTLGTLFYLIHTFSAFKQPSLSASNEIVFLNFYADWCRFSNILMPVFDDAADKVALEFPDAGRVVMGKVDCESEKAIATRFHITKYPTLKLIRNGQPAKKEYRGQRSSDAFVTFIKEQMEDHVKEFTHLRELTELESNKRTVIGENCYLSTCDSTVK